MQKIMHQKITLLASVIFGVIFLSIIFSVLHHDDGDSRIYFELVNQSGEPTSNKDLQDQFLLVFFGFTHCPDVCPIQLSLMTQIMQKLDQKEINLPVQPVFISVDSKRDTPEVIHQYLQHFDARFIGLTGTDSSIKNAAKSFKTLVPQTSANALPIRHSAMIYLIDPNGRLIDFIPENADANSATSIVLEGLKTWI